MAQAKIKIVTPSGKLENTSKLALEATGLPASCRYVTAPDLSVNVSGLPINVLRFETTFTPPPPSGYGISRQIMTAQASGGSFYQESAPADLAAMFDAAQAEASTTPGLDMMTFPYISSSSLLLLDSSYGLISDSAGKPVQLDVIMDKVLPFSPNATAIAPDLSSVEVTPLNQLGGRYVQGKSRAQMKANATGRYGAAVTSYKVTGPGIAYAGAADTATTGFIPTPGDAVYTVEATDARGMRSSRTVALQVAPYQPPAFGRVTTRRANSSGDPLSEGTYATANAELTHAQVLDAQGADANPVVTALDFKKSSEPSWTAVPDGFASGIDKLFGGGLDAVAYDVRYAVSDQYTTVTYLDTVSAPVPVLDFKNGGDGLGIGMEADGPGLHIGWETWFYKPVHLCPYEVDDLYLTASSTNPAERWAGTTWELFGAGRVPVCIDSADSDINAPGKTVGAKTVALTTAQTPSHTHTMAHTHTTPAHAHGTPNGKWSTTADAAGANPAWGGGANGTSAKITATDGAGTTGASSAADTGASSAASTGAAGSGSAHENRPPSIACYIWRRVA
jgi:microcystin-dependent protein